MIALRLSGRIHLIGCAAFFTAALSVSEVQSQDESTDSLSSSAALDRVKAERQKIESDRPPTSRTPGVMTSTSGRVRLGRGDEGDPIYRNGVSYYHGWTIRAGATRLRLPAYDGWRRSVPGSEFFDMQTSTGELGEHLASVTYNELFMRTMRTKYASFYSLVWVPQEYAFKEMSLQSFGEFKEKLQASAVALRKQTVQRGDFVDFEDYLNFKFGHDENVEDFVDGYMIRAIELDRMVIYFATSNFIYQSTRQEIVEPMIMTVTYALVEGKLVRIDVRRLFTGEDDVNSLITFSQLYVNDMRQLNSLGARKTR